MRIERVILDASPVIVLFKSGLDGLLPQLFTDIIVPDAVRREVMASGSDDPAVIGLANAPWAVTVSDVPIPLVICQRGTWTRANRVSWRRRCK